MRIDPRRSAPLRWIAPLVAFAALPLACAPFSVRSRALGLLGHRSPEVLYSVPTHERALALTIDDGPDPDSTPRILEVLARHEASATFFLIADRISGNEALVEQIVASGHELGNHLTRDEASIDLPREEFERELLRAHGILSEFGAPRWFRPGSGWYDDEIVYLDPGAAYHEIAKYYREEERSFGTDENGMRQALVEDGLVVAQEDGRLTARISVNGRRHRVMMLSRERVPFAEHFPTVLF